MANVKLGNKIFKDVDKIKVNTDDGSTIIFDEPPESYDGEIFSEPGTVSEVMGLNIAYGDTPPEDTSKLWIKCNKPDMVQVTSDIVIGTEEIDIGIGELLYEASKYASTAVGNKIYMFGGATTLVNTINVFDTTYNSITTLDTILPKSACDIASAVVGTKIYLFGGYGINNRLNTINVFDITNNSITTLNTKLPRAITNFAPAVVGTKVYLFGGVDAQTCYDTINIFNTETNTITTLGTKLPTAAYNIASAVVGTKVYLFGGQGRNIYLNTINVFDTETNTITTLDTKLPTGAYGIASAVLGSKVYLFGGGYDTSYLDTINVFDSETNTITTLNITLPNKIREIASVVIGTKVYLLGGYSNGYRNTINIFNVSLPLVANNLLIEAAVGKNIIKLLPSIEIGINNVYLGNSEGYAEKVPAALYVDGAWTEI